MSEPEHLTNNQIAGYYAGMFAEAEQGEVGRHLLVCASCRNLLPVPSVEGFWAALMDERETEEIASADTAESSPLLIFSSVSALFGASRRVAWRGAALIVLFALSFLIWFGATRQSGAGGEEVAQVFETEFNNQEQTIAPTAPPSTNNNLPSSADSNRHDSAPKTVVPKSNATKEISTSPARNAPEQNLKSKFPKETRENISSTRGGIAAPICGAENALEMAVGATSGTVTLKWKKVRGAAKYHLYVSDDEEILLDEFETEQETSYVLKTPLDPVKTYNWKVVITLEDGKTIIGDAQKFTVRNLESNQKKSERKDKSAIRCTQEN